jgi:hypothetical protein
MRLVWLIGMTAALCVFDVPLQGQQPDWQIHSIWCTRDGGSSGNVYKSMCANHDQFDSIVACQKDAEKGHPNDPTSQTVINAGKDAVNAYMADKKPAYCSQSAVAPPPRHDYYVTARFNCVSNSDGSSAGSCDVTQYANSCAEARNAIASREAQLDPCVVCTNGVTDHTRRKNSVDCIQGGPCQGQSCH